MPEHEVEVEEIEPIEVALEEVEVDIDSPEGMLESLIILKESAGYRIWITELTNKYDATFRDSMNENLSDSEVRRKVEQNRGLGYASLLLEALITSCKNEIEAQEEGVEITED